ncbi:hypothetical protein ABS772_21425 [Methylorubrum podarium]|uniref:PD-(D/E)XK nuclease superfamily protein n=1 Tax=Methylorubrum podarium TaxID=200476 RepID=A0ABV1QSW2_9HYPH
MSPLVQALKRFNRKERFWLLSDALGKPFLSLDRLFIEKISKTLGIEVPSDAWWAFDYHLDWLAAVLWTAPGFDVSADMDAASNQPELIYGSQQDVDMIIAFDETVIVIEAKLATSWSNRQLTSKIQRLSSMPTEHVRPYFILTSPSEPTKLAQPDLWSSWVHRNSDGTRKSHFMKLEGDKGSLAPLMVSRCHADGKKPARGAYWKVFEA